MTTNKKLTAVLLQLLCWLLPQAVLQWLERLTGNRKEKTGYTWTVMGTKLPTHGKKAEVTGFIYYRRVYGKRYDYHFRF